MIKRILAIATVSLLTATTASAQIGGGGGGIGGGGAGGGGRGGHGGSGGGHSGGPPSASHPPTAPAPPTKPVDASMIVGVVKAIDTAAGRITIAYEPVEARNWPSGTMPFQTESAAVLKDTKVGDKIRFKLESQQVSEIIPYAPTSSNP